jgi:MFS family permease
MAEVFALNYVADTSHGDSMLNNPTAARNAIMAVFVFHGMLLGGWVTHIPLAKIRLDAGLGLFGIALLSFAVGAVIAMPIAGAIINKKGSAAVTLVGGLGFAAMLFAPALAPTLPLFMLGGALLGACVGSMDVAMNAHGLAIEKALKKPVMSGFHGGFSVGAAVGTIGGAWLLGQIGDVAQLVCICVFCAIGIFIASRYFLPASIDQGLSGSHFAWPTKATIGLGGLCFLALMIEGSVADWAALMLQSRFTLEAATAAMAFGFYQTGMAVSRFTGDMLRQKFGAVPMVFWSALLTAAGTAAALLVPSVPMALVAFAIGGIGIGNVAPVLFAGGGRLEPDAPGRGIAAVTSMGYTGFLAGPPLIGIAAEFTNLQWGLALTVMAALIIAAFAGMVRSADTY